MPVTPTTSVGATRVPGQGRATVAAAGPLFAPVLRRLVTLHTSGVPVAILKAVADGTTIPTAIEATLKGVATTFWSQPITGKPRGW